MQDWAALLTAIANILWPTLVLLIALIFRNEIKSLANRLRRGKVLGQEIELDKELDSLQESAMTAASKAPDSADDTRHHTDDPVKDILVIAASSPKAGLILLTDEIEKEVRQLLRADNGSERERRESLRAQIETLHERGMLPTNVLNAVRKFWLVRNTVVHNREVAEEDVLRALDSGITILRALRAVPRKRYVIYHPGVEVFADHLGKQKRQGVLAVILEVTSAGGTTKTREIFPTTRNHFRKGMRVEGEWNHDLVWDESWYRDPDTGIFKHGWSGAVEFIGRSLDEELDQ